MEKRKQYLDGWKIVVVMVTFNPSLSTLFRILETLECLQVVVVDNGSFNQLRTKKSLGSFNSIEFIGLHTNIGIAAAQNIGIQSARVCQATHVLLMDQDSVPASDMVQQLHYALSDLPNAAAVGPAYFSEHQGEPTVFTRLSGLRRIKQVRDTTPRFVTSPDALIASGCLIPMTVLDVVGDMREDLFIDYVDTEWGLRAQALGYSSYAVWSAKMSHQLGTQAIKFMGRNMIVHPPLRRYYQYRNAVLLYKMKHIPINWKINDVSRLFVRAFFYVATNSPRYQNLKMIALGLWHGILGKSGQKPSEH